jgi:predicted transcriptional regulator
MDDEIRQRFLPRSKRGVMDISISILDALSAEALRKTRLGYKTNLDSRAINKYTKLLVELELIEKVNDDVRASQYHYYTISQKGLRFLEQYFALKHMADLTRISSATISSTSSPVLLTHNSP